MTFKDADALPKMREPDAGGEAGHAGADDGDVVMRAAIHVLKDSFLRHERFACWNRRSSS
jgi:hypothetical protein